MDITNRDIINSLSNEDLADCLLHDDFVNMSIVDSDFKEATSASINEWLNKKVDENSWFQINIDL